KPAAKLGHHRHLAEVVIADGGIAQHERPARHDALEECRELVVLPVRDLKRRLGGAAEVMNVWHRVQHGFGADALFGVQQGNDKRFQLRTLEHQPAHEVGAAFAEEAGAYHLEGSQSGPPSTWEKRPATRRRAGIPWRCTVRDASSRLRLTSDDRGSGTPLLPPMSV